MPSDAGRRTTTRGTGAGAQSLRGAKQRATLQEWKSIPGRIRSAVATLKSRQLDVRGGSENWSIREYAHHLVEANLVASTIILAAIGRPGCTFDWSWLIPDSSWMDAQNYGRRDLQPALRLLDALASYIGEAVAAAPENLRATVVLAGTARRRTTVQALLAGEVQHARKHLRDIAVAKRRGSGKRRT